MEINGNKLRAKKTQKPQKNPLYKSCANKYKEYYYILYNI